MCDTRTGRGLQVGDREKVRGSHSVSLPPYHDPLKDTSKTGEHGIMLV